MREPAEVDTRNPRVVDGSGSKDDFRGKEGAHDLRRKPREGPKIGNGTKEACGGGNEGGGKGSGKHIGIRFRTGTDGIHWPAMGGGGESKEGRKGSGE